MKFSASGALLATFNPGTTGQGTDWLEPAADQSTIFCTPEGSTIKRFNVCTNSQLADFTTGLPSPCYALRILPTGGVIVASSSAIKRLDAGGTVIETYDAPGENNWFAMNLDPDKTSLWSANFTTGQICKFDIQSGSQLLTFASNPFSSLASLAVFGEIVVSQPSNTPTPTPVETPTITPTVTPTFTATETPTVIRTSTVTSTPTDTRTVQTVPIDSPTLTPTETRTPTITSATTPTPTATDVPTPSPTMVCGVQVQICIALDGSGSIQADDLSLMTNGLANAVKDGSVLSPDRTVELTIVQFGRSFARVEVSPTVIAAPSTASSVAARILAVSQIGDGTSTAKALDLCRSQFLASSCSWAQRQVINLESRMES